MSDLYQDIPRHPLDGCSQSALQVNKSLRGCWYAGGDSGKPRDSRNTTSRKTTGERSRQRNRQASGEAGWQTSRKTRRQAARDTRDTLLDPSHKLRETMSY